MCSQTRLFVGNLPDKTNEEDLRSVFSSFGEISNLDLKSKPADDAHKRNFAFITYNSNNNDVERCINHFSQHNYKGQMLYVTRARESFLERLQRERDFNQKVQELKKNEPKLPTKNPEIKLSEKLNPRKRQVDIHVTPPEIEVKFERKAKKKTDKVKDQPPNDGVRRDNLEGDVKKQDADKKRMESMKMKRQEFKEKKMIIKTGLVGIDKVQNKKIVFSDDDSSPKAKTLHQNNSKNDKNKRNSLFDEGDTSDDDVNFEVKKQFEGKKGQKVLDLQSRFKSDKRFTLDERFVEDESEGEDKSMNGDETVEMGTLEEKDKQLNILQDVLGVTIRKPIADSAKKAKSKPGMFRFDPAQPEHAKFLAPVEEKQDTSKKPKKKKKDKQEEVTEPEPPAVEISKAPEVSKEQFYTVSETLKEAIAQPTTFSLRSLFGGSGDKPTEDPIEQETGYIPLEKPKVQKSKVKNPLEPADKNPFVYDSSDSETEEHEKVKPTKVVSETNETKAVWKENLFFTKTDNRFIEGLSFFNKTSKNESQKERRELKSLMKKRIYNNDRKNQMFQKKIGGRKKTMKKTYRKKS